MGKKKTQGPPLLEEMLTDAEKAQALASAPGDARLAGVSKLVNDAFQLEVSIKDMEGKLKELQEQHGKLVMTEIPDAMKELGLEKFSTSSGLDVEIKNEVAAQISEANKPEAFAWLRKNKLDDIIKGQVIVTFGRGEDKKRVALLEALAKKGYPVESKESIHASTLKAFVKEQRERGVKIPEKPFGIYDYKLAKIKLVKAPK